MLMPGVCPHLSQWLPLVQAWTWTLPMAVWAAGLPGVLSISTNVLPLIILATHPLEMFNVMMPNGACKCFGKICVKSSFLARSAGVRWCLLEVSSHFSSYSLEVCRCIPLPLMHSTTQSFGKLQLQGSQKYVQVPGCNLSSIYMCFHGVVMSCHWVQGETTSETRESKELEPPSAASQDKWGFLPIKTSTLFY